MMNDEYRDKLIFNCLQNFKTWFIYINLLIIRCSLLIVNSSLFYSDHIRNTRQTF